MRKIHLLKEPSLIAKYDAFQYQKEAFEAVKDLEYAAIFHEQGLGKTKIAIDILLYWLTETSIDTVLIVTKKQLVQNWLREFKNHTAIKPAVTSKTIFIFLLVQHVLWLLTLRFLYRSMINSNCI